jgi:hypothetical protein
LASLKPKAAIYFWPTINYKLECVPENMEKPAYFHAFARGRQNVANDAKPQRYGRTFSWRD